MATPIRPPSIPSATRDAAPTPAVACAAPRRRRLIAPGRRAVIQAAGQFQHLLRAAAAFAGSAARLAGRVVQLLHLRRRSDGDGRKFGERLSILARGGGEALQRQFNAGQPRQFPRQAAKRAADTLI